MRPTYSPRMPRHMSWTPPRNRMEITIVGKPGTGARPSLANCDAKIFWMKVKITPKNAKADTHKPKWVASRKGSAEKDNKPSAASLNNFEKLYFGSPAARAGRSYGTPIWRKPDHARRPRTN